MMWDTALALAALLVLPVIYFGPRPLLLALCAIAVCLACDVLFCLVFRRTVGSGDPSPLVTGLVIALLMPANAPYWLPALAAVFAMLAAKLPFGSTGRNLFNPAAAGVAFATVCQPALLFSYADPAAGPLPLGDASQAVLGAAPGASLAQGLKPSILPLDMLWGVYPGPMGCTAALVIGAASLYLFFKRTAQWETTVFFLLAAALAAVLFPRIACSALTSVKYELLSGSLLFCSVFLAGDPVTSPRTFTGRCLYGFLAGALVMAVRHAGAYEQGACFAILIANAFTPVFDQWVLYIRMKGRRLP